MEYLASIVVLVLICHVSTCHVTYCRIYFFLSARLHLVGVIFRSSDLPCCQKLFHISVSPTSKFMVAFTKLKRFSPSNATDFLICLLKTSGNLWFSDVFRTYRKIPLTCDGLKLLKSPSGSVFCRHK